MEIFALAPGTLALGIQKKKRQWHYHTIHKKSIVLHFHVFLCHSVLKWAEEVESIIMVIDWLIAKNK